MGDRGTVGIVGWWVYCERYGQNIGGCSNGKQQVFIKMSQETSRRYKVSVSAKVLSARCGGMEQQLDHNLPVLYAKSKVNRQNLCLLLKRVPSAVQTLTTCNLSIQLGVRSWSLSSEMCLHPLLFSVPPFTPFNSAYSLLFSHLFSTLTSFMTFVNVLQRVSCYCCFRKGAGAWSNKDCMWSLGLVDLFLSPKVLSS